MKSTLKKIVKYWLVSLLSFASLAFVLGGAIWACVVLMKVSTGPFILHFNDIDGITTVGGMESLIFMGILGVAIVALNFFIALELELRNRVLGKVLASLTLVVSILLFLSFVAILNVN
jgi:hypothetical protein